MLKHVSVMPGSYFIAYKSTFENANLWHKTGKYSDGILSKALWYYLSLVISVLYLSICSSKS